MFYAANLQIIIDISKFICLNIYFFYLISLISPIRLIGPIRLIPYKNIHYSLFIIHYSASSDGVGLTIAQDEQLSIS